MAQFLSPEWFEDLERAYFGTGPSVGVDTALTPSLVVEVSVSGAPQGEVRYQVVVEGEGSRVLAPGAQFRSPQVELRTDYATVAGLASGELSPIEALSLGRARVSGSTGDLYTVGPRLAGLNLLPAALRASTTF